MTAHAHRSAQDAHLRATRFFWCTLILATCASVAGNIAHAILASTGSAAIAAAAAVVPPVVLLASTHGVALLVRTRTLGPAYWCALSMTVVLASCAFVLSFDALRGLAVTYAGFPPSTAWLWPLSIDLGIAQSTLALLSLTGGTRREYAADRPIASETHTVAHPDAQVEFFGAHVSVDDAQPVHAVRIDEGWLAAADAMLDAGVTRIDREKLAQVLAELAAGTAPSTVARNLGVGYSTVGRIVEHLQAIGAPAA